MKQKKHFQHKSQNYFSFKNPFFIYAIIITIGVIIYLFVYKQNISLLSNKEKQVIYAQTPSADVPVGTVVFISTGSIPTGYIECNGQSTGAYPALAAVVGAKVPDLRGQFIRGWDNGRGVDINRGIGTTQLDDFKTHTHSYFSGNANAGLNQGGSGGMYNGGYVPSGSTGSTTETRPKNVALMAIIKY